MRSTCVSTAFLATVALLFACTDPRNDPKPEPRTPGNKASGTVVVSATASSHTSATALTSAKPSSAGEQAVAMLDLGKVKLNEREKGSLMSVLDSFQPPCSDMPITLAQCVAEKRDCKTCKPAAELLGRLVRAGHQTSELEEIYKLRFDPTFKKKIEVGDSPTEGPADAPVTIVEWADFQCPHCNQFRMVLQILQERFPDQIRLAYKFYKLDIPGHEHALEAAYAAQAAKNQNKFWEMHKKLFDNQESGFERADIRKFARELDLDMDKFKKDMDSEETKKIVAEDIKVADGLGINGTPFIWIEGRLLPFEKLAPNFFEELENWVKLDIQLAGQTPAEPTPKYHELIKQVKPDDGGDDGDGAGPGASASASASASAAPSASASASASPSTSSSANTDGSSKPKADASASSHKKKNPPVQKDP